MKVFLYGLLAVGMRHYGNSGLVVGEGYYLRRDRDNPHDENAVAIVDRSGRKKASLKRDAATVVAGLFDDTLIHISRNKIVLKPKTHPTYNSPIVGMAQRCNIGFYCKDEDRQVVATRLSNSGFRYCLE